MSDLVEFLLARIAEDEHDAEGMAVWDDGTMQRRSLAECEAKRRIIAEHRSDNYACRVCANDEDFSEDSDGNREWYRSAKPSPCPTLRFLALPYAGHPGYRVEWRP